MITEFFIFLAQGVMTWVLGLLPPADDAQSLVVSAKNALAPIISGGAAISAWMPWGTLAMVFGPVMGVYFASFAVKVLRQLFSHAPMIGGSG
ncbi:MAG: hypothetical protein K0S37_3655 [Microbacterium sp.]|jgi:hypothetical protein|nr:hypothetical protein [Microbacterium sp.]